MLEWLVAASMADRILVLLAAAMFTSAGLGWAVERWQMWRGE